MIADMCAGDPGPSPVFCAYQLSPLLPEDTDAHRPRSSGPGSAAHYHFLFLLHRGAAGPHCEMHERASKGALRAGDRERQEDQEEAAS
eukprot:7345246-Prymnesium_polylepis.1